MYKTLQTKLQNCDPDSLLRYLMLLGFCIDLSGDFGLRSLLVFPTTIFLFIKNVINFKDTTRIIFLFFILIIYPFCQFCHGLLSNGSMELALSQFLATFQMFIIYICFKNVSGKVLLKELCNTLFFVQILSLVLFFGGLAKIGAFLKIINYLGAPFDGGYFGFLLVGGVTVPQVYFKSTLFFIFTAVYFFSTSKYLKSVISLLTLLLTLSKSGVILALIGVIVLILRKGRAIDFFFILVFIFGVLFLGQNYINNFYELKDSYTAEVRFKQMEWFQSWIVNEPINFLFGSGLGTKVYIPNLGIVSALELDHINTIRKYGLIWFLTVFSILFILLIKLALKRKNFGVALAFLLMLIGAGTNPVLITSLFFIVSLTVYKLANE